VRFRATDCAWTAGEGGLVEWPIAAILLLLTGRDAALAQLSGPGAARVRRDEVDRVDGTSGR
jgi:hypothetical protein